MKINENYENYIYNYLIENCEISIIYLTEDLKILDYNKPLKKMLGLEVEIKGKQLKEVLGEFTLQNNQGTKVISCNYKSNKGTNLYLQGDILDIENEKILIFKEFKLVESKIISEITKLNLDMANLARELKKKNKELNDRNEYITLMSNTDFLTGLYNRRHFFKRIEELVSLKVRANDFEIGIIFSDIDFFKKFNDTYGHNVGDKVLIEFSKLCRVTARKEDVIGRLGGEEFCIIIRCNNLEEVGTLAERIRAKCKSIKIEGVEENISASFGVCLYKKNESIEEFIKRADKNMYKAKKLGRDRIVLK